MLVIAFFAAILCVVGCDVPGSTSAPSEPPPLEILDEVVVGSQTVELYVHYATDAAVLGFAVTDSAGVQRYCPMYGSTYRGLPAVTLQVHGSAPQEELWVTSSWQGYETLAYHRLGADICITRYGAQPLLSAASPGTLGGKSESLPPLDPVATSVLGELNFDPGG